MFSICGKGKNVNDRNEEKYELDRNRWNRWVETISDSKLKDIKRFGEQYS